ncbi:hypothetical protein phiK7A1_040c [Pseudomonas phage phiK7A1]|uniref:Uncharacterized protein n=1 Tax=Pseudomonas phage phiK7A1 TaxID=2759194 RepID=A0A7H0XFP0_9CAUD|nr:hypothetical protein phiK7A1_040c [Pseudomonas phage phiK7A1]
MIFAVAMTSSSCDHYLDCIEVSSVAAGVDLMKRMYSEEFNYMDRIDVTPLLAIDLRAANEFESALYTAQEERE